MTDLNDKIEMITNLRDTRLAAIDAKYYAEDAKYYAEDAKLEASMAARCAIACAICLVASLLLITLAGYVYDSASDPKNHPTCSDR